jgi:amino acid adenylation domain-containing protein
MSSAERHGTIRPRSDGDASPLSFGQERLFLLDRIMPGVPAYNVPRLVRVRATLDETVLQRALDAIVARHEILRTRIQLDDGVPVQHVAPTAQVELTTLDLRGAAEGSDEEETTHELLAQVACRAFDLSRDVLLRAAVVHLDGSEDLLLLVNHHIGSDHASAEILFAELDELYDSFRAGREPELPELSIQYGDFASWQREHLDGELLDELVLYWRDRLAGAPAVLELPIDRPRPAVQTHRGELLELTFPQRLADDVSALARAQAASVFMVLVAALDTVLHRYSGSDDIVVGVPASGRHQEEIQHLVGFFSNTLVLRTDLSGDPTFSELVARVKATTLEAQAYQELPFEKLVEMLDLDRTPSHSPLFQVLLGFDVAPATTPTLADAPLEEVHLPGWKFSRLDVSLNIRQGRNGSLGGSIEYATDLFDRATIERLLGHLQNLLAAAAHDPQKRLSELALVSESEHRQLTEQWNGTVTEFRGECVDRLIARQAALTPDAVAVECDGERLSFSELERRATCLGRFLRAQGVGPEQTVGIATERSVELLVGLLGIWKAGGAYVPIDPTYPIERQAYMLDDAEVRVVVTQERLLERVPVGGAQVVCLDRDWSEIERAAESLESIERDPEQAAYVIYTSGSTGEPKGVEVPHRALANFLCAMREHPGLGSDDVLVAVTTLSFDIAGLELYLPLFVGGRVVVAPAETAADPRRLAELLELSQATVMQATPTTWRMLLDAGWRGRPGFKALCGGEPLPSALADELTGCGLELWNMYGPTETTIWSTVASVQPGEPLTIGRPIANTSLFVLDAHLQPVPVGVAGELFIGGHGLARGYRNRPDLTAERFLPNPFGPGRVYRTGDLVRYRNDGTLEFLGRLDHQVKVRGFRIELGEIETALERHDRVASAVCVAHGTELVAYVIAASGETPSVDELRNQLRAVLPSYMVPSAFVLLDSLPLTANGKVNRAALPAPDAGRRSIDREYVAPGSPIEEFLASIWRDVLGVEWIGIDDDFFDLGGHSLLAVKMTSRVLTEFDVDLPLITVFAGPTIRALAKELAVDLARDAGDDELATLLLEVEGSGR